MGNELLEDILTILCGVNGPLLISDLKEALRDGDLWGRIRIPHCWKLRSHQVDFESDLRDSGFEIRGRKHGAGRAMYVAVEPFSEVSTRYGMRPVR